MAGRSNCEYTEWRVRMSREKIILIGGGGHCRSCIDVIEQEGRFEIAGIVDVKKKKGQQLLHYRIIASDDELAALRDTITYFLVTLGQTRSVGLRKTLYDRVLALDGVLPVIVSPRAYVSPHACVGAGTVVMHDAMVNASASVGANCIINSKALIEHDVMVGDHCHISTGAIVNGGVTVGEGTFFGSNAVSAHGISIGPDRFIKAGRLERGT